MGMAMPIMVSMKKCSKNQEANLHDVDECDDDGRLACATVMGEYYGDGNDTQ